MNDQRNSPNRSEQEQRLPTPEEARRLFREHYPVTEPPISLGQKLRIFLTPEEGTWAKRLLWIGSQTTVLLFHAGFLGMVKELNVGGNVALLAYFIVGLIAVGVFNSSERLHHFGGVLEIIGLCLYGSYYLFTNGDYIFGAILTIPSALTGVSFLWTVLYEDKTDK